MGLAIIGNAIYKIFCFQFFFSSFVVNLSTIRVSVSWFIETETHHKSWKFKIASLFLKIHILENKEQSVFALPSIDHYTFWDVFCFWFQCILEFDRCINSNWYWHCSIVFELNYYMHQTKTLKQDTTIVHAPFAI